MKGLGLFLVGWLTGLTVLAQPAAGPGQPTAYRFVVTEVPANTPHDANLYITGTFNKWNPADPRYKLQRQTDNTYRITVLSRAPRLDYKFTRGSWQSVEGNESGKIRPNRTIARHEADAKDIDILIRNWEDLTGTFQFYSVYDLLLLFSCLQGLLLLIAIPTSQPYNRGANHWLMVLIGLASLFIAFKVVGSYRNVAHSYPKLLLIPDFIWFLYAPLFYFYVRRLLFDTGLPVRNWAVSFIPVAVQFLAYLPYLLMDSKAFQLKLVGEDSTLRALFLTTGLLALLVNVAYWFVCRRTLRTYHMHYQASISSEQNLEYLNTVLVIQAVCLILWTFLFGLVLMSRFVQFDVLAIADRNVDIIYLAFSTITYFLGYTAIRQPEVFKLPQFNSTAATAFIEPVVDPSIPARPAPTIKRPTLPTKLVTKTPETLAKPAAPVPDPEPLKQTVEDYMHRQKPYTNPSLTIHELAVGLKMPPHVLSRVINDGFGRNFFDFINAYRVEELKRRVSDPRTLPNTLLGLAFEVGFNSKTSFNRAFKKATGQTPSDYFAMSSDEQALR